MKKIFYLASIAALAFSSCAKDETTEAAIDVVKGGSKIVAAMEADDTRTELVKNGNAYDIVWKSTDGLSVYEKGSNGNVTAFSNRLFQLDNASDGLASGAFTGSKLTAGGTYVAVYPYDKTYSFAPNWNDKYYSTNSATYRMLDPESISVNIPAEQEYVGSGTFNTNTIPAISTQFTVGEDGNATVKMQPVVDYVMVDIVATEAINDISLRLYNGDPSSNDIIEVAGTTPLKAYYANGAIRYVTANTGLTDEEITLKTKDLADDVSLAKANTYVFAIPGGILGMNKNVGWGLFINGAPQSSTAFLFSNGAGGAGYAKNAKKINTQLNAFDIDNYGNTASRVHNDYSDNPDTLKNHKENGWPTELTEYAMNLENMVFYLNASDIEGNPMPFEYNPEGDVTIYDELDLLDYFYNYDTKNYGDAYVAEGATFDLSVDNLSEILRNKKNIDAGLRTAINDYIMPDGIFPVIEEYKSQFRGNGAVISNIERPLAGMGGLFGAIEGVSEDEPAYVQNITLANVVAATTKVGGKVVKGNVLASTIGDYASISKVAISKLNADAVVGEASLGNFNAISVAEGGSVNKDLNHIVAKVMLNNDYKPKAEAWAALSAVGEGVFHTIVPIYRSTNSGNDTHHVITLPAGDYEDLTVKFENIGDVIDAQSTVSDASAVASLLIGEVSYWTGGYKDINTATNNVIASGANYASGYYVNYAEELANGYNVDYVIELSRAMNFEHNDLTSQIEITGMLSGGAKKNAVTGLTYVVNEDNWSAEAADDNVAPFALTDIENIVFDGLTVAINTTGNAVPTKISGISDRLKNVEGVTINNLVIDAYSEGSNNTITDANYDNSKTAQRKVGWLSATAEDIAVYDTTVNGVDSNVIALSAMVSYISVKTNNSIFDGSSVTGKIVKAKNQVDIKEFTRFNSKDVQYNLMGSLVGMLDSQEAHNVGVKFNDYGSVKPVSLYRVDEYGYAINVLYNNKLAVSLYHADDDRNE